MERRASHRHAIRPDRVGSLIAVLLVGFGLLVVTAMLAGCGETPTTTTTGLQQGLTQAEAQPTSSETPASFISLCANCHDSLDAPLKWRQDMKLVFSHPAHFAKGIRCEACHQEFPHKPGKTLHVPVETCFMCHGTLHGQQGVMAATTCSTCHTSDVAKLTPDHLNSSWVFVQGETLAAHAVRGKADPLYCKMCHEATFCQSCHKIDMPHPADWLKVHGAGVKSDSADCIMCHQNGEPGTPGSPAKLVSLEKPAAAATPSAVSLTFCNDCHHKAFPKLPDWGMEHKVVVLKSGAEQCFACHQPTFCDACHVATGQSRGVLGG